MTRPAWRDWTPRRTADYFASGLTADDVAMHDADAERSLRTCGHCRGVLVSVDARVRHERDCPERGAA